VKKKIVFLTGTRADFGKLKSLIDICLKSNQFEIYVFATGMHMHSKYGSTIEEIKKQGYPHIFGFINQRSEQAMDISLARTMEGFSNYVQEVKPDMIVVHGDRSEALAGALVGGLNNILVAHIEGGEISGTVDELLRHAVSKMSHCHFVANEIAKKRLIQMGESENSIYIIGSPDVDLMLSDRLPELTEVKERYDIPYDEFSIVIFHPVTTDHEKVENYTYNLTQAMGSLPLNYIVILPNNDLGSEKIINVYKKEIEGKNNIRIFPSIRFEYFLVLLKNAQMIVGNSSAGIREAPYYGTPTVDIGTRQNNRSLSDHILHSSYETKQITQAMQQALTQKLAPHMPFGKGQSDQEFFRAISQDELWQTPKQKYFCDY
jgi:UDP-N-acetylglucosamine 2-epimerase (hydrolysing)